jgi:hypothetical protein
MKSSSYIGNLLINLSFFLLLTQQSFAEVTTQLPMYGGEDRNQHSELIAKATRTFGTREHASEGYVEHGFDHYSNNELDKSMNRFNQAWLLNPDNPYPYLGFALLMNKKEQPCEAYNMFKLANEKGLNESGFLADYAYTTSQCALLKEENEQQILFKLANKSHEAASQTSNKRLLAYVYHSWAKSYFIQNDLVKTKEMIEQSKNFGGKIDHDLLEAVKENK